MAKFRRKPIIVDAEQFWPDETPHPDGVQYDAVRKVHIVVSLEGPLTVSPGDWIITGVHGEHYPCKPDIFAKTYEPVEE